MLSRVVNLGEGILFVVAVMVWCNVFHINPLFAVFAVLLWPLYGKYIKRLFDTSPYKAFKAWLNKFRTD